MPRGWLYITLACAVLTAGCATGADRAAPRQVGAEAVRAPYLLRSRAELEARVLGPVALDLDSALPLVQARDGRLFAGDFRLGGAEGPWRYRAGYALGLGDIVQAGQSPGAGLTSGLAEQRLEQQMLLELPELAGAPLALGYTQSSADRWTMDDEQEQHRQVTSLRWAPDFAALDLRLAGPDSGFADPDLALDCALRGDLRVPLGDRARRSLQLSGRGCDVVSAPPRFAGLSAQSYRLAYAWGQPGQQSRVRLGAIAPARSGEPRPAAPRRAYELGLSQSQRHDGWTARLEAALRARDAARAGDAAAPDAQWMARARLSRRLPTFSLTADWSHGHDPHWFLPGPSRPASRLGLALSFSRWARSIAPALDPELGLDWHWSQSGAARAGSQQELRLFLSAFW